MANSDNAYTVCVENGRCVGIYDTKAKEKLGDSDALCQDVRVRKAADALTRRRGFNIHTSGFYHGDEIFTRALDNIRAKNTRKSGTQPRYYVVMTITHCERILDSTGAPIPEFNTLVCEPRFQKIAKELARRNGWRLGEPRVFASDTQFETALLQILRQSFNMRIP